MKSALHQSQLAAKMLTDFAKTNLSPGSLRHELVSQLLRILKFSEPQVNQGEFSAHFLWYFSFVFMDFCFLTQQYRLQCSGQKKKNLVTHQLSSHNTPGHKLSQDTEWERHPSRAEPEPRYHGTVCCLSPPKLLLKFGFHCRLVGS